MSKRSVPSITRASLLGIFVEGALRSEGRLRTCALKALNRQLQLFPGDKGEFTARKAKKLLDAAKLYMADPANQIDVTRPTLIRKTEDRAGTSSVSSAAKRRTLRT